MAKLFCPNCARKKRRVITFILRYFGSEQKWKFPQDKPHYCRECKTIIKEKDCLNKESVSAMTDGGD